MLLEKKIEFVRQALPPMARHTLPFLTSVIGITTPQTGKHVGSGLRCILQGRRAILTAGHVIKRANEDFNGFAVSAGYGVPPYQVHGPIHVDPVADLAAYFLPDDYPDFAESVAFWPRGRMEAGCEKLATDYLFLHGFPGARSYSSLSLNGVVSRSLPYGAMQRLEDLPNDLESFQFAIEYDPQGMASDRGLPQESVDPRGLSGSPIWRLGASGRTARDWAPDDSLLVGFVTRWNQDAKVLIATSTAVIPPDW